MKAPPKRSSKLPKIEVYGYNNAVETKRIIQEVRAEQLKIYKLKSEKGSPQPTWEDVANLFANQINMLHMLAQLQELIEDPFVAGVVTIKKDLENTKSQLQDLKDEFNRHENDYSHDRSKPYYLTD